jgi:hypothetical protein
VAALTVELVWAAWKSTSVEGNGDTIVAAVFGDDRPSPALVSECCACEFFETDCLVA